LFARPLAAPSSGQGDFSSFLEGTDPFSDEAAIDPDGLGHLDPACAGQRHVHRDTAQLSLGRWREFMEIAISRQGGRIADPRME
jgi:hypothetical protein